MMRGKVVIICGSQSDMRIAKETEKILNENKVDNKIIIASAHREPEKVKNIVNTENASIFIAIAGLSAALPGFIASISDKPVIGVPIAGKLHGLDSLLSIVQMPSGVPVATVGIDNGKNAAYLAVRILRLFDNIK